MRRNIVPCVMKLCCLWHAASLHTHRQSPHKAVRRASRVMKIMCRVHQVVHTKGIIKNTIHRVRSTTYIIVRDGVWLYF